MTNALAHNQRAATQDSTSTGTQECRSNFRSRQGRIRPMQTHKFKIASFGLIY